MNNLKSLIIVISSILLSTTTFGQTTYGYAADPPAATDFAIPGLAVLLHKVTIPAETIESIGVYPTDIPNLPTNAYGVIYSDNAGMPGTVLAMTNAQSLVVNTSNTIPLTAPIMLAAGDYWVGFQPELFITIGHDGNFTGSFNFFNSPFGVFPDNPMTTVVPNSTPSTWLIAGLPSAQVPTLSQWGIIALSLILIIFGVVSMKEKRLVKA